MPDHHALHTSRHSAASIWRTDIDGLRAIAVLGVIAHHFFPEWISGGFIGVDIFFVISGFLIGGILLDSLSADRFNLLDFYAGRMRRILPALLLVMSASLIFGWFALLPDDYSNLGKHTAGGAGFVSNLLFWKEETAYFNVIAHRKPLLHLWSLGVEEQFYIVFPIILWGLWKKNLRLITFIALLAFLSCRHNMQIYKKDPVFDFYVPMTRFWELLAGVMLAMKREKIPSSPPRWQEIVCETGKRLKDIGLRLLFRDPSRIMVTGSFGRNLLSLLGIMMLAIALLEMKNKGFPGKQAILPVLGTVCLIAAGQQACVNRVMLTWRPLRYIGLISYPLYLWHWPLLSYTVIILGEMPNSAQRIALVGIAILLSALTCKFVETPIRFGKDAKNIKVIVLLSFLGILGGSGGIVFMKNGFPDRFPASTQIIMKAGEAPPDNNQDCLQAYAGTLLGDPDVAFCLYSNIASPETILLVGDSHARSAFPAIADYNAKHGKNTLFFGMTPKDWETRKDTGYYEALFHAIADPKIHKIFVISRGVMYIKGWDWDTGQIGLPRQDWLDNSLQPHIDRWLQLGKEVFVVAENPVLPFDPRKFLPQPFRKTSPRPRLVRADVLEHQKEYIAALKRLRGCVVIYSIDAFCPSEECLFVNEQGENLYRDANHLSSYAGGNFLLEKLLKPYLDPLAP